MFYDCSLTIASDNVPALGRGNSGAYHFVLRRWAHLVSEDDEYTCPRNLSFIFKSSMFVWRSHVVPGILLPTVM